VIDKSTDCSGKTGRNLEGGCHGLFQVTTPSTYLERLRKTTEPTFQVSCMIVRLIIQN